MLFQKQKIHVYMKMNSSVMIITFFSKYLQYTWITSIHIMNKLTSSFSHLALNKKKLYLLIFNNKWIDTERTKIKPVYEKRDDNNEGSKK